MKLMLQGKDTAEREIYCASTHFVPLKLHLVIRQDFRKRSH